VLIILGVRVFYRSVGQGVFYCRRCSGDREYRRRAGRRWFVLFFIPAIPLARIGHHVQCASCRTRYVTDVLAQPTTAQMQAALPAGMRAAATAMLRSGDSDSTLARQRAISMVTAAGLRGYGEEALERDLEQPSGWLRTSLHQIGAQLTIQAREWYLADVIGIGMADGSLTDSERSAAQAIGLDLGMTQAQVVGVVAMAEQSAGHD
jgi:hypothetical protein